MIVVHGVAPRDVAGPLAGATRKRGDSPTRPGPLWGPCPSRVKPADNYPNSFRPRAEASVLRNGVEPRTASIDPLPRCRSVRTLSSYLHLAENPDDDKIAESLQISNADRGVDGLLRAMPHPQKRARTTEPRRRKPGIARNHQIPGCKTPPSTLPPGRSRPPVHHVVPNPPSLDFSHP